MSSKLPQNVFDPLEDESAQRIKNYQFFTVVALFCVTILLIILYISYQSSLGTFLNSGYLLVLVYSIIFTLFLISIPWKDKSLPYIHAEEVYEPAGKIYLFLGFVLLVYFIGNIFGPDPYVWMLEFTSVITIVLIIFFRSQITMRLIIAGITVGIFSGILQFVEQVQIAAYYTAGINIWNSFFWIIAFGGSLIIGLVLLRQTPVLKVIFLDQHTQGNYIAGLRSVLFGGIFSIPVVLLSILNSTTINNLEWGSHGYELLYAVNNVLVENTIMNLFFVTWTFSLLYRKTSTQNAQIFSIIFTSFIYLLGNVHVIVEIFTAGVVTTFFQIIYFLMFYTLPPAVLYLKRDFESALGYRMAIASIPFIVAFIVFGI